MNLNYDVLLISKETDIRFDENELLNQQTTSLPSILKWNPTEFTIYGSDYREAWNTYLFRVIAVDKNDTQFYDDSFELEVETIIDCVTDVELIVPDSFSEEISYEIFI